MPPHSASVYWAKGMLERAQKHIDEFKYLELPIEGNDDVKLIFEKGEELNEIIKDFMGDTYKEWSDLMKDEAGTYLEENVIRRDGDQIVVSFNTEVS